MSFIQRIFRLRTFSLLFLFFILFSCRKTGINHVDLLSVNKTSISIDTAIGTTDSFTVQSTVSWNASLSPGAGWLHIDKTDGPAGNTMIKLTIVSNDITISTQVATITIAATGGNNIPPVTLTVTRKSHAFRVDYRRALGGTNEEGSSRSMTKTLDGGVILTGATSSNDGDVHGNHGDRDMWIVKLNAAGDTVWTKTYGGSAEDGGAGVIATADGGYMVCGSTSSADGDIHHLRGGFDAWILKLNGNGDTVWTKTYGGTSSERANSIIATADGSYTITGFTGSIDGDVDKNHGDADVWVFKLNAVGDVLWSKTYGGSSWDEATAIITTPDGGYAIAGLTNSNDQDVTGFHVSTFFVFDMWIVRIDATGNKLWTKTLGGSLDDVALSMVVTANGFVITGYTNSNDGDVTGNHGPTAFFDDMWVVKISDNGAIVWAKAFGGRFDEAGLTVINTSDGGYAIIGLTNSNDGDVSGAHGTQVNDDIWLVKLDADGKRQWTKAIGGTKDDLGGMIIEIPGGYIISGYTNSNDDDFSGSGYHGNYDIYVLKLLIQ